jgi:hypothetical protein
LTRSKRSISSFSDPSKAYNSTTVCDIVIRSKSIAPYQLALQAQGVISDLIPIVEHQAANTTGNFHHFMRIDVSTMKMTSQLRENDIITIRE